MRMIGTLPGEPEARRFEDYLLTLDIKSMVEAEDDEWIVWIFDEDHLETARDELAAYRENTDGEQYRAVTETAGQIRKAAEKQEVITRKHVVNFRDHWRRPAMQRMPLTLSLIAISIGVTLFSSFGDKIEPIVSTLGFAKFQQGPPSNLWRLPTNPDGKRATGDEQILGGQIWRLVTPIFIHLNTMHIIFNVLCTYQICGMVEMRKGAAKTLMMVLLIAAISNYGSFVFGTPKGGGMSGVIYGLFGYAWMKTLYEPEAGFRLPQSTVFMLMAWFFLCMTPLIPRIDNWAHGIGLAVGVVLGYGPILLRDLKRR